MEEVWGTGTAAVISPVGKLRWGDEIMQVKDGGIGELSHKLYDTVSGIQLGKIEDTHGGLWKSNKCYVWKRSLSSSLFLIEILYS